MPIRTLPSHIKSYKKELKSLLATTRFNDETWKQNQEFLQMAHQTGQISNRIQCIYPSGIIISKSIPYQANVFILEMNNEQNKIMGIGLIKNTTPEYNKYSVYSNSKYNQFSYQGGYRIDYQEFTEEEIPVINLLEKLCFKGHRHQKRLNGIKAFPNDILYDYLHHKEEEKRIDIMQEITKMFKKIGRAHV